MQVNKETCSILVSYDGKCRFHPYPICYKVVLTSSSWETLRPVQCQTRNRTPDRGDKQRHSVDMCACWVTNISDVIMDVLLYKRVFAPNYTKLHNKWTSGYNTVKQVPFMHDR